MQPAMRGHVDGYTLLELLVILAIVALLASRAMPDFGRIVQERTGEAFIHELARILSLARAEAVASGSMVTLCRSRNGLACNGSWEEGMLLFTDGNRDRVPNGNDRILQYSGGVAGTVRLRSFPNRQYVQFSPLGFTNKQNGSFTWCPRGQEPEMAQQLIFSQSGRARLARDSDGDGLREGADGAPLVCGV